MINPIKFKKNLIFKRVLFLMMLAIAFFAIFNFSSQDGLTSGSLSLRVTNFIVKVFSKVKNMDMELRLHYIEVLHPIVRKLAHFGIYTVVGFSIMGFWCTFNIKNKYKLLWSSLIGIGYSVTDEIHQIFTPGRSARLFDVMIDSIGVLTGIFVMILLILLFEAIANWIKK